jgi:hypothetical protein
MDIIASKVTISNCTFDKNYFYEGIIGHRDPYISKPTTSACTYKLSATSTCNSLTISSSTFQNYNPYSYSVNLVDSTEGYIVDFYDTFAGTISITSSTFKYCDNCKR